MLKAWLTKKLNAMANKIEQNKTIGFKLNKITTEQFAIIIGAYNERVKEIKLSINLNFIADNDNRIIASLVKVQFEQTENPFLLLEIANHFKIEESVWLEMQNESNMIIPKEFAIHLVMLTIGTLRGALHSKTENTEFNKYFLPTINVTELIKSDIVI